MTVRCITCETGSVAVLCPVCARAGYRKALAEIWNALDKAQSDHSTDSPMYYICLWLKVRATRAGDFDGVHIEEWHKRICAMAGAVGLRV